VSLSWGINSHGICNSVAVITVRIVAAVCLEFSFVIFVYIGMMMVNLGVASFVILRAPSKLVVSTLVMDDKFSYCHCS